MKIQRVKYRDIEQVPHLQVQQQFKQDFQGSAPTPFIGRFGYPKVNIGILSPQFLGDVSSYDSPRQWSAQNTSIGDVASRRYSLVNSRTSWNVKQVQQSHRFLDIVKEVGMAKRSVDVEVSLQKQPKLNVKSEREIIPFGPASEIKSAQLTGNPAVDSRAERVVADTGLKAAPALLQLYRKGFEENFLTKLISTANVGLQQSRKLVPTRWSITAVDDTLGKQLIVEVKDFPIGEYQAYFGGGWGNYYLVLFFPAVWSYELFETYLNKVANPWSKNGYQYSTDFEGFEGRKTYAEECAGGYYAARLPVLEKMKELKRQQACLALRFITPEYKIPLGVWVCREAARKSLAGQALCFSSEELLLAYARALAKKKFSFDLNLLLSTSKLLKEKKEQKRLGEFG
ncbi:hypothetical protein HYS49_01695 [Candidatus Woesearchaeota archaeon]|nr:hypothetical protein [Candidatus Woesearchaeota archaeon]